MCSLGNNCMSRPLAVENPTYYLFGLAERQTSLLPLSCVTINCHFYQDCRMLLLLPALHPIVEWGFLFVCFTLFYFVLLFFF